ncbi:hypothetical protein Bca4012_054376 [Brassica carinata]
MFKAVPGSSSIRATPMDTSKIIHRGGPIISYEAEVSERVRSANAIGEHAINFIIFCGYLKKNEGNFTILGIEPAAGLHNSCLLGNDAEKMCSFSLF